ncbi:AsnC family protein [Sphaerisporangium rufum]|uniref:AsnC family protein n=1 Tax=Sphaerisporangium rufum TaxID=1381558 RepID=UPI00403B149E
MRVVDGMHRLCAARLRGAQTVAVRFFDGDDDDAFVAAVRSNIAHGLPLSLADRTAAATRIIRTRPDWSDRMIASVTGLAPKTVGAVRRSTGDDAQSNRRVGRDGRVRPVNNAEGRRLAGALLTENPDAPLREIARAAGVAPSTVLDVRQRLERGADPVPPRLRDTESSGRRTARKAPPPAPRAGGGAPLDKDSVLRSLRRDPSLRFSEFGRALLRQLDLDLAGSAGSGRAAAAVPSHCVARVATLARENARFWEEFAQSLDQRARAIDPA